MSTKVVKKDQKTCQYRLWTTPKVLHILLFDFVNIVVIAVLPRDFVTIILIKKALPIYIFKCTHKIIFHNTFEFELQVFSSDTKFKPS